MHELSVTESILKIAIRHAQERGAKRITALHLVIGQWSSIVDDSVKFYWDIISEGTIAKGATLHFQRIAAELACRDCGAMYRPSGEEFICPECSSSHVELKKGNEFRLESIEIEENNGKDT